MPSKPKPCLVCRALNTRAEHAKRNTLSSAITFQQAVGRIPDELGKVVENCPMHRAATLDQWGNLRYVINTLRREAGQSRAKNDARRARLDITERQRQKAKEVPPDAA